MTDNKATLPKFQLIGWQGLEIQMPEDWRLTFDIGDSLKGFIRFASQSSNLEIKWETLKKRADFSIDAVSKNLINKIEKSVKKKNFKLLKRQSASVSDHKGVYFHYRTEQECYGLTWYCDKAEKLFILLHVFKPKEYRETKPIFEYIVNSLKCHSLDEQALWSIHNFSLKTPSSFRLGKRKILLGHINLSLLAEKPRPFRVEKAEIFFQCWSLANVKFEDAYNDPEKWFKKYYEKEFRKKFGKKMKTDEFQSTTIREHAAKTFTCTIKSFGLITSHTVTNIHNTIWYCPESNRMYMLTFSIAMNKLRFTAMKKTELLPPEKINDIINSVSCHVT